jgi:hypothetical protein
VIIQHPIHGGDHDLIIPLLFVVAFALAGCGDIVARFGRKSLRQAGCVDSLGVVL